MVRLDKFLKVSRVVKRRTVAKKLSEMGRIIVNGRIVKASYEVKEGDVIEVVGDRLYRKVKVVDADKGVVDLIEEKVDREG